MQKFLLITATALLAACASTSTTETESAAAAPEITVPGTRSFPESITSTADGTIFIGSLGHGNVYRVAPGSTTPEEFVKPGAGGLNNVLGVLADEASGTLWVCSNNLENKGDATALKAYDVATAEPKGSWPLPGANALCNDIAIAGDGAAYVADTRQNQVLRLAKGGAALEVVMTDERLAGVDGLDFGAPNQLVVNSVSAGKLFRLDLGADGKATALTELAVSRMLERPDGMRAIGPNKFLLAENAGRMDIVTVAGDNATVDVMMEGKEGTPAVTVARGMAWLIEGKLNYRNDPEFKDKDPGVFKMFGMPLPN